MPTITRIAPRKASPQTLNVFLDGKLAFGVNVNVIAQFGLRIGQTLGPGQIAELQLGQTRQKCMDAALQILSKRLHSRAELLRKLGRKGFDSPLSEPVLAELSRLGYVDDARFARVKALSAARHKHHGRRRAFLELRKAGVQTDVANQAVDETYQPGDALAMARELAQKHAPRLRKLDPRTARRRLVGMLQRRGFDYESIKPIVDEALSATDTGG